MKKNEYAKYKTLLNKLDTHEERAALLEMIALKSQKDAQKRFNMEDILFDKQLEVFKSTALNKVLVCSRRAGKSSLIAADMLYTALHNPNVDQLYVGLTKGQAKRSVSKAFSDLIKEYGLPCKMNNNTLEISFKNGSKIYLEGAKDHAAIVRFRGMKLFKAVLDEAQSFPPSLAMTLVSDIIMPALGDLGGSFIIAGTPDPLCNSVLFKAFKKEKGFKDFESFQWNVTHNSKFPAFVSGQKTPDTFLSDVRERKGFKETDPTYRREYLGEFVESLEDLVYGFHPKRDIVNPGPLPAGKWFHIVSGDVGFCDADGITVVAFSYDHPVAYVVESYSKSGQDVTAFANKIKELRDKYSPMKIVIDPGGGGVKVVAELNNRYQINAQVAEKYSPKIAGCALVSSEFKREKLKIIDNEENEVLISQLSSITFRTRTNRFGDLERFVPDGNQVVGTEGVIGDDVADSFLYAFKQLKNYWFIEPDQYSPEEEQQRAIKAHKAALMAQAQEEATPKNPSEKIWF
jgi:hypothetical protein